MTGVMSSAALLAASASSAVRAARLMPGAGAPSSPAEVPSSCKAQRFLLGSK